MNPTTAERDRTRLWAVLSAALFLPAALAAGVLSLSSDRASRCLTYGEQCTHGLPWPLLGWSAGAGAVALLVALAATTIKVRRAALGAQILAEGTALLVILSYA
jgi:hypothetical protein